MSHGQLRVWWIPQIPMKAFTVEVASLAEAKLLLNVLADYDTFQFENNIKPDYCNSGGLQVWHDDERDFIDWMNDEGDSIDDLDLKTATPSELVWESAKKR